MMLRTVAGRPSVRDVDQAAARAVDTYVDRLRIGIDVHEAYGAVATDLLRGCAHLPVDRLRGTVAVLDDDTRLRFEPAMVRLPWSLQLRHMLGYTTPISSLPIPSTRGSEPAVRTRRGTQVWSWPVARGGTLRAGLRGLNGGAPVLVTSGGVRLWSPEDAACHHDGLLVDGPTVQVWLADDTAIVEEPVTSAPVRRAA